MNSRVIYGFDYLSYYYYWLSDKFYGYPLVVQISITVVLLCVLIGLFLLFYLMYFILRKRKERKILEKLSKQYKEKVIDLCNDEVNYTPEEVVKILNYDKRRPLNNRVKRLMIRTLVLIKTELPDDYNRINMHNVVLAFDFPQFFVKELQFASVKYRVRCAMWIRFLEEGISDTVLVRLIYNKNAKLRKAAQATFMWSSKSNPFRFFDDQDFDEGFQLWDRIDIHSIFVNRRRAGWGVPTLLQWIDTDSNSVLKALFISEIAYLEQTEECPFLLDSLSKTDNSKLRGEIISTLGRLKYKEAEVALQERYRVETEEVKRRILTAISMMNSGKALSFLRDSYVGAMDINTRIVAISAIYSYGARGKRLEERLKSKANEVDLRLFNHIENPLISNMGKGEDLW